MTRLMYVVIAALLVGGGWILGSSLRMKQLPIEDAPPQAVAEAGTEARVAKLEDQIADLATAVDRLARKESGANGGSEGGAPRGAAAPMDMEAGIALRDRTRDQYSERFLKDPVDPEWSARATSQLLEKVAGEHVLSAAPEMPDDWRVDCRSSMCRMSFTFSDAAAAADWADAFLADLGSSLGSVWSAEVRNPDGSTTVEMYGFR